MVYTFGDVSNQLPVMTSCDKHTRVFERVIFQKTHLDALSTFENRCLAGELTFGDSLQDSGDEFVSGSRMRFVLLLLYDSHAES